MPRAAQMQDNLPILADGRKVGTAILKYEPKQATKTARAAAFHVSTPNDIQICPFSDGSHDTNNRGGVGLAYRRQWLPREWVTQRAVKGVKGEFVERAWPYSYAKNNTLMEVVGIVEALHAANESIQQHIALLKKHACTVQVKATTDCQPLLAHIAKQTPPGGKVSKAIPHQIIKQIKDQIVALQSHGIKVSVEIHWCPRNMVPQLILADKLAGKARKCGLAYCNATENLWARATKSVIMRELLRVLSGDIKFAPIMEQTAHSSTTLEKTITARNTTEARQESRQIERTKNDSAASSRTTADSQTEVPLPDTAVPWKPATASNTGLPTIPPTESTAAPPHGAQPPEGPTRDNKRKREAEEEEDEESEGRPTKKPMSAAPPETQPTQGPANAGKRKRKAEEEDGKDSEGATTKKPKPSPAESIHLPEPMHEPEPIHEPESDTMRPSWGLDLKYKRVFIADPKGVHYETPVQRAEFIRMVTKSTLDTWEKNTYVNDGVSSFCLVERNGYAIPH